MNSEDVRGRLDAVILAVLERGPAHGYAVIEAVRDRTGGELELTTGSVYPALRRLESGGLVSGSWGEAGGRKRRTYELTRAGRAELAGEREQWRTLTRVVDRLLEKPA